MQRKTKRAMEKNPEKAQRKIAAKKLRKTEKKMRIGLRANLKNTTPYAGLYPVLKFTLDEVMQNVLNNVSLEKKSMDDVKQKQILSCLSLAFIGADKLERAKLLQNDALLKNLFDLEVTNPENISRFLQEFDFRTTTQLELENMNLAVKAIKKANLTHITIDIDSSVKSLEGNQEGARKGYNPENIGNNCHNILFAFVEEIKVFVGGYIRPGNTGTGNGAVELVQSIVSVLGEHVKEITFRFDCGYFSEELIEAIESLNQKYVMRAKGYSTLIENLRVQKDALGWNDYKDGKELAAFRTKPDSWKKERRFIASRIKKEKLIQLPLDSFDEYDYYFFVTNQESWTEVDVVWFYDKRGNSENHIKECKYDFSVKTMTLHSFWATQAMFQLQMMAYNILILFKLSKEELVSDLRETAKTFRLKFIFVCGKIIFGSKQLILDISKDYAYKDTFFKLCS